MLGNALANSRGVRTMSSGRQAKLKLELVETSNSSKMTTKKTFSFPKEGFAGRGVVVSRLLDWLLNHNLTYPGKMIVHGFTYDVKRFDSKKRIKVIKLGNNLFLRKSDYVEKQGEVKR